MRLIKCKGCGAVIEATGEQCYCDECRKEKKNTLLRERVCKNCGVAFIGYPRSFFCDPCRKEKEKERKRIYNQRAKAGTALKIGSLKPCENCGKDFSVNSARQRYCEQCRKTEVKKNVSALKIEYRKEHAEEEEARKKANKKFRKICIVCGVNFDDEKRTSKTTCSEECKKEAIARSNARTAQKHYGRKTEYGVRKYSDTPKSGIVGVTFHRGKWQATYKKNYIGVFDTPEEAEKAIGEYRKGIKQNEENSTRNNARNY